MSAALAYQYDCWSGLKYVNDTTGVNKTMSFLNSLVGLSSNALGMMVSYDNFGDAVSSWTAPRTERDGFWEKGGSVESGGALGFPSNLTADVTVCKDAGSGCYKTVQEAVNAAPSDGTSRFVIHIKEGVYEEKVRVPFEKKNVVFVGDGMGKTVITGSSNVGQPGMSTYESATVGKLPVSDYYSLFFAWVLSSLSLFRGDSLTRCLVYRVLECGAEEGGRSKKLISFLQDPFWRHGW